ncbi:hypothetical protein GCM10018781_25090 [Kitasatospora indigofera]|uniref:Uncharacterized protein n=1 Tax=Kitasatospora indigofera TaxID=67307 RepID=A0A919KPY4_9ACTN|nr:hypothetical protein GCM10018781_25090 [Kitasatospora indigofera]
MCSDGAHAREALESASPWRGGRCACTHKDPGTPQAQGQSVPSASGAVKTNATAQVMASVTAAVRLSSAITPAAGPHPGRVGVKPAVSSRRRDAARVPAAVRPPRAGPEARREGPAPGATGDGQPPPTEASTPSSISSTQPARDR